MGDESRTTLCIRLWDALLGRGELATREVMGLLEVDKQRALRSLRALQDAGLPVYPVGQGSARRWKLDEGYRRTRVNVTLGDAMALEFGRQLMGFLGGTSLPGWMADLQEKLRPALPEGVPERLADFRTRLYYLSEPYRSYDAHDDVVDEVLSALLQSRELEVEHVTRTYPCLRPLTLVVYRRALYLLAEDPAAGIRRRLALDRVRRARRLPSHFPYPDGFDPAAELLGPFGIESSGQPEDVVLRFDPRVAHLVRSRVWHPTATLTDLEGGGVELRMRTHGRELVRLALEYGETVEVVQPPGLRAAVIAELRGALARYDGGGAD